MARSRKKGVKPPIKSPALPAKAEPAPPTVIESARTPYLSAAERMSHLPTFGEALTAEKIQSVFAHLLFMSITELKEREKSQHIPLLEQQAIRFLIKTMREFPPIEVIDTDDDGNPIIDTKTGKPKKRFSKLHPDQLQHEKQSLEVMKYLHERAFGKPKVTIEHTGLPAPQASSVHFHFDDVLKAMDTLPKNVIEAIATVPKAGAK